MKSKLTFLLTAVFANLQCTVYTLYDRYHPDTVDCSPRLVGKLVLSDEEVKSLCHDKLSAHEIYTIISGAYQAYWHKVIPNSDIEGRVNSFLTEEREPAYLKNTFFMPGAELASDTLIMAYKVGLKVHSSSSDRLYRWCDRSEDIELILELSNDTSGPCPQLRDLDSFPPECRIRFTWMNGARQLWSTHVTLHAFSEDLAFLREEQKRLHYPNLEQALAFVSKVIFPTTSKYYLSKHGPREYAIDLIVGSELLAQISFTSDLDGWYIEEDLNTPHNPYHIPLPLDTTLQSFTFGPEKVGLEQARELFFNTDYQSVLQEMTEKYPQEILSCIELKNSFSAAMRNLLVRILLQPSLPDSDNSFKGQYNQMNMAARLQNWYSGYAKQHGSFQKQVASVRADYLQ